MSFGYAWRRRIARLKNGRAWVVGASFKPVATLATHKKSVLRELELDAGGNWMDRYSIVLYGTAAGSIDPPTHLDLPERPLAFPFGNMGRGGSAGKEYNVQRSAQVGARIQCFVHRTKTF